VPGKDGAGFAGRSSAVRIRFVDEKRRREIGGVSHFGDSSARGDGTASLANFAIFFAVLAVQTF
jgi:hypothetical protein